MQQWDFRDTEGSSVPFLSRNNTSVTANGLASINAAPLPEGNGPYFSIWAESSSELRESISVDDDAAETDSADEDSNHDSFTVHSGLPSASFDGSGVPNCSADLVILSRPYNKLDICKAKEIEVGTFILRMRLTVGWVSLNSGFSSAVYFSEKVH